jgi:5-methylcytosine-specific restriction endonuclease McrA
MSVQTGKEPSIAVVARYLACEVGEGNVFTMDDVRATCPGVAQVDRRVRELRQFGWELDTYKTSLSLRPHEVRLVKVGARVWEPGCPKRPNRSTTAAVRNAAFERDHYRCQVCGIGAGEAYLEPYMRGAKATLTVGFIVPRSQGGDPSDVGNVRTECALCNRGAPATAAAPDPRALIEEISGLARADQERLAARLLRDERDWAPFERAWAEFCHLPEEMKEQVRRDLVDELFATA